MQNLTRQQTGCADAARSHGNAVPAQTGKVPRHLLRMEAVGGILFDRAVFRLTRLSEMAAELLTEMQGMTHRRIMQAIAAIGLAPENDLACLIDRLQKQGAFADGQLDLQVCDYRDEGETVSRALATPLRAFLNLNDNCNLECQHCFMDADLNGAIMPKQRAFDLLREMHELGVIQVTISGGEPFMCPYIMEFLQRAADLRLFFSLSTNGQLLTARRVKELQKFGDRLRYVNISLDGPRDVNDRIRGAHAFDRAVAAYGRLRRAGFRTTINVAITSALQGREADLVQEFGAHGIDRVVFSPLKPVGRVLRYPELLLDEAEMLQVYSRLGELARAANMQVFSDATPHQEETTILDMMPGKACPAGGFSVSIRADGSVYPCAFLQPYFARKGVMANNLHQHSLRHIWQQGRMFRHARLPATQADMNNKLCPAVHHVTMQQRDLVE